MSSIRLAEESNLRPHQDELMNEIAVEMKRCDIEWDLFTGDDHQTQLTLTWKATRQLRTVLKTASPSGVADVAKSLGLKPRPHQG